MKMRGMALACATHACASAAGNEVDVARARGSGGGTDRGHRWKVGKPVGFNNCGTSSSWIVVGGGGCYSVSWVSIHNPIS